MFTRFLDGLNARTGYRTLLTPVRRRVLPGGPSWAYSVANCLLWLVVIEIVTGILLMSSYSPSVSDSWASVHYIEHTGAGSFIRGLHYFAAQAMIILFGLHTIRVLVAGAYRAPHELVWISGLILIPLMVVWAITGNPLSGSQKGFSQIEVEGNIIASTPFIGPIVQRLLLGGDEPGNLTLTHLYTLHVVVMPLIVGALLFLHIGQIYRHGLSATYAASRSGVTRPYFPFQTVRNMVFFGLVFGLISFLAWRYKAPLEFPADPNLPHSPRPEWYFLFMFELRRYFVGSSEPIVTIVLPGVAMFVLLAMPLLDRVLSINASKYLRMALTVVGLSAFTSLTAMSVVRDAKDERHLETHAASTQFGKRAHQLADRYGIPIEGAIKLLRSDPATQGPLLFKLHCAACHPHVDSNGEGITVEKPSAPNLYGFGTPDWIAGFLDPERIVSAHYFGSTAKAKGEMANTIAEAFSGAEDEEAKTALRANMRLASVALAAEAQLPPESGNPELKADEVASGAELIAGDLACTDCHKFHDQGELGSAPDLTGYGSYEWLRGLISNVATERFYGAEGNDRMPAYARNPHAPEENLLTPHELDLLVRWLRRDTEGKTAYVPTPAGGSASKAPSQPAPTPVTEPKPAEPAPSEPAPAQPAPSEPAPAQPVPAEPKPAEPTPAKTEPTPATPPAPPMPTPATPAPASPAAAPDTAAAVAAFQETTGGQLYKRYCARCHAFKTPEGQGFAGATPRANGKPNGAPNLYGFASRAWLAGMVHAERIVTPEYFGNTAFKEGEMAQWVRDNLTEVDDAKKKALDQVVVALSAEAQLGSQKAADDQSNADQSLAAGKTALVETFACTDCHKFHDQGELGSAPDLTGYGSVEWLTGFISNPKHERFYSERNDRMPAYAESSSNPGDNILSPEELALLIKFVRGEEAASPAAEK